MNKVSVRCWEVENHRLGESVPDHLIITYPEDNSGHELITCLNCGEIYAVTVVKEVYIGPPLAEKVKGIRCVSCGEYLIGNYAYYPETYIADGKQHAYRRNIELPDDKQSIVKELFGIYD